VLQAELLQSRSEVKSLLDKISELTREKAETVSHVVHMQLMQIADEKALQAETKCRQLESEVCAEEVLTNDLVTSCVLLVNLKVFIVYISVTTIAGAQPKETATSWWSKH